MNKTNDYKIICIDGGGTKTRGVLFVNGNVAAERTFEYSTRIGAIGFGEACDRTLHVITELCHNAQVTTTDIDIVVAGLAGVWLTQEKARALNLIKTLARQSFLSINDLVVTSDAELALEGAFDEGDGIITIVGTGSIGLAKKANSDEIFRCGGWGIELDDEGSGAWLGREGITAVVKALDGRGNKTSLTQKLISFIPQFDLSEPRTLVSAYNDKHFEYQKITPLVMECAAEKDKVCSEIVKSAAKHLAAIPNALLSQFAKNSTARVALMGGIITNKTLLAKMLIEEIKKNPRLQLVEPEGDAIRGALKIALRTLENID